MWLCLLITLSAILGFRQAAAAISHQCLIGAIHLHAFDSCPPNYIECNGQVLNVNGNEVLASVLRDRFGGSLPDTFAIPNLNGRVVIGPSSSRPMGSVGGSISHTLTVDELPKHRHTMVATSNNAESLVPGENGLLGQNPLFEFYGSQPNVVADSSVVGSAGSTESHENRQPYLVIGRYCMCSYGVYPTSP